MSRKNAIMMLLVVAVCLIGFEAYTLASNISSVATAAYTAYDAYNTDDTPNTPPTISNPTPIDNSATTNTKPEIGADYSDVDSIHDVDVDSVIMLVDDKDVTLDAQKSESSVRFVPKESLSLGQHSVKVIVFDQKGYSAELKWVFSIVSAGGNGSSGSRGSSSKKAQSLSAPLNLKATVSALNISLSWDPVQGASGYNIYRKDVLTKYAKINNSITTSTAFADPNSKANFAYTYYVTAVDSKGIESAASNTVSASLAVKAQVIFSDVPAGSWYQEAINKLVAINVFSGYSDGSFKPNQTITRAEFAKVISLAQNRVLVDSSTPSFNDVNPSDWYYAYIETAKANGTVQGYADGSYGPMKSILRAEITAMLSKSLGLSPGSSDFIDIDNHWAKSYIESCSSAGFVAGYPNKTFKPDDTTTRAEAASMISKMLK
jgi:hypothetical protein